MSDTTAVRGAAERLEPLVEETKDQVQQIAQDVREQAADAVGTARDEVSDQIARAKDEIATTLRGFSDDLEQMAPLSNGRIAGQVATEAAQRAGEVADWLEQRESKDVMQALVDAARRRPMRFLLLSATAGVLVGRMTRGMMESDSGSSADSSSARQEAASVPDGRTPMSPPSVSEHTAGGYEANPVSLRPNQLQTQESNPFPYLEGAPVAGSSAQGPSPVRREDQ